ncbi:hypothetical protein [Paenibacillus xylaniclasticus]|uniref:hypothetical protein n=1 Tax=Paenibacillus xylaniclasticus TaxID=588083 RepID=UPI000FD9353D|nr:MULTISPECIES: hypothetical protein [Paenibacillus]GFN29924.1 hypothetical protein PCURB6_01840 [Paenibacillus curdlanolyticus]
MNAFQPTGPKLFEGEKWCVLTGVLGPVLGLLILIYVAIFGNVENPQHGGDLLRAASFNTASGIFIIAVAAFVPLANFKPRLRWWIDFYIIFSGLGSYILETIQHARGVSPRIPTNLTTLWGVNFVITQVFAAMAVGIMWYTIMVMIGLFRKDSLEKRPLMVWAARYGMIGSMLGFIGGLWMIIDYNITLTKELTHSIIYFHGYAFHGLQAVPFMAAFLERVNMPEASRRRLIHWGGWTFTLSAVLLGLQVLVDHKSLTSITPIMSVAAILVVAWACLFAYSGLLYLRSRRGASSIGKGEAVRQS